MRVTAHTARHPRRPRADSFRSAYLAAGVAMARLTQAAVIIDANAAFAAMLGRPAADLAGQPLMDLLHADDAAAMKAGHLSSFAAGAIHAELRFKAKGTTVLGRATISIAREPGDRPDSLVLTVEDLSALEHRLPSLGSGPLPRPAAAAAGGAEGAAAAAAPDPDLLNRRLREAVRAARHAGRPLALLMIDFDLAAATGDEPQSGGEELLDEMSRRLGAQLRPRDFVARTGGTEFGIVLAEVDETALAEEVGHRLLAGLEPHFQVGGKELTVPVSMGASIFPANGRNPDALVRHARRQLYLAGGGAPGRGGSGSGAIADQEELTDQIELRVAALEPVSLFQSVSAQVLRRIARYMSAQTAVAGAEVAGPAAAPALRIIEEGLCEVRSEHELPLMTLGPGDFMGAEALLLDDSAAVHARALTDVRLLVLEPGVLDEVAPPGTAFREALRAAAGQRDNHLRALLERPQRQPSEGPGQAISVYSAKGGSGRTTLALNLASELGRRHSGEVLLVDLALPYNHVALLANLSPSTCLARAGQAEPDAFGPLLWSAVLPHQDGFMVLPATLRPEESDLVTPELVGRALAVLGHSFNYVVFDLGVDLDDRVLAALELSDQVVLMATPELASMHDTRRVLDLATRVLNIPEGRIHTVLNHRTPDSALTRRVVEEVLGRPLAAEFRYYGAAPELAGLEGRLQVRTDPRGQFSRSVRDLVDALAPKGAAKAG